DDEIPLPLTLKREKRGAGKENKTCSEGDTGRKPEASHLFFPPGSKLQECFGTENGYDGETDHGENEPHLRCAEFVKPGQQMKPESVDGEVVSPCKGDGQHPHTEKKKTDPAPASHHSDQKKKKGDRPEVVGSGCARLVSPI